MDKNIIRLYITDDDADDRDFLTEALARKHFHGEFRVFENGLQLIDFLKSNTDAPPDLILLDLNMPVKNGYQTLKELRENEDFRQIPVAILTASSKIEDEKYCYELGCANFMRKPLSLRGYEQIAEDVILFAELHHKNER